jgi:hypothetical protein
MATPFNAQGVLNLPGVPGLPAEPLPFGIASQYDSRANFDYLLPSSSGTKNVDFGTMPTPAGAKLVLLTYESVGNTPAPPIAVLLNGGNQAIEVTAGGFLCLGSPTPAAGITAMSISYTGAGKVRVWLLG